VIHFLDTNTVIYALKGTFPGIPQRIRERSPDEIKIPSIVEAELLYGAEKSSRRTRTLGIVGRFLAPFEIVPFGSQAARHYATIRARPQRSAGHAQYAGVRAGVSPLSGGLDPLNALYCPPVAPDPRGPDTGIDVHRFP
jgi:tRNA(fMet)-specific endonuclease VapC